MIELFEIRVLFDIQFPKLQKITEEMLALSPNNALSFSLIPVEEKMTWNIPPYVQLTPKIIPQAIIMMKKDFPLESSFFICWKAEEEEADSSFLLHFYFISSAKR